MKPEILILDGNNVTRLSKILIGVTPFVLAFSLATAVGALVSPQTDYDTVSQNLKAIDSRENSNVKRSAIGFKFFAEDICNENIGRNGLCLDIWGKGSTGTNTITASGLFETYVRKPVDMNKGKWFQLSRGHWSAVDLLTTTEKQVSFKASTSSGIIFIELTEGESENSGKVCAYGPLIAVEKAVDAVCIENAFVVIEKVGN